MEGIISPCYHPLGDDPRLVLQIRYTLPPDTMARQDAELGCRHQKGDLHGTDDHSRAGRNRRRAQARVDDPRDRSLREEAAADHNKRNQEQEGRLQQGAQGHERDMPVVRGVQAHARLRHELRHEQVVQALPPVLSAVQGLRSQDVRQARRPAFRLQRMHERAHLPRSPRPTGSRNCASRAATSTPRTRCSRR